MIFISVREDHDVVNVDVDEVAIVVKETVHVVLGVNGGILKSYEDNIRDLKVVGVGNDYMVTMGLVNRKLMKEKGYVEGRKSLFSGQVLYNFFLV